MRVGFARATAAGLAVSGLVALAWAQGPNVAKAQNVGPSPEAQVPGPNATPPGAGAHASEAAIPVQPVPGAMPDSDTVPSTVSDRNAADDKLIVVGYTFKHLSPEQRRVIYQELKDLPPPGPAPHGGLGVELPSQVALLPVSNLVVTRVPDTNGYRYTIANNKVLLVAPATRVVVGEFGSEG
jgi:hypothetical protein